MGWEQGTWQWRLISTTAGSPVQRACGPGIRTFRHPCDVCSSCTRTSRFNRAKGPQNSFQGSSAQNRNLAFHFCLPPFDTYQHLDNFAVRTLSGAYDQPPGGMSMAHLERAKGDERMRNTLGGQEVVERCRKRKRVLQESRRGADVVTVEL